LQSISGEEAKTNNQFSTPLINRRVHPFRFCCLQNPGVVAAQKIPCSISKVFILLPWRRIERQSAIWSKRDKGRILGFLPFGPGWLSLAHRTRTNKSLVQTRTQSTLVLSPCLVYRRDGSDGKRQVLAWN
jgi:hypothetical protein